MAQTPPSLLSRLRECPGDSEAWQRFDAIYRPLLSNWLRRYALQPHDAEDILQDIFQRLLKELPHFQYDPAKGSFRGWLRGVLVNALRAFWRLQKTRPALTGDSAFHEQILNQMEDESSDMSKLWDKEHDLYVTRQLLNQIRDDFEPATWNAFERLVDGEDARKIAADLNLSVNAVFLAKSRVLRRLRQYAKELTD